MADEFESFARKTSEIWATISPDGISLEHALSDAKAMAKRGRHVREEAKKARELLKKVKKEIAEAEKYIKDAGKVDNTDYGNSNEFLPLKDKCVEAKHDKYKVGIEPFEHRRAYTDPDVAENFVYCMHALSTWRTPHSAHLNEK